MAAAISSSKSPASADDVDAGRLEHAGDPLAQQQRVLADHDAHGITPVTSVPAPGGLSMVERAVERGEAVLHPAQAGAGSRVGAAAAVVGDLDRSGAVLGPVDAHVGAGRARVADDVGQRLGDEEVGGGLDRRRAARLGEYSRPTGSGARRASVRSAATSPSSVSTAGWMPRASSRSSSVASRAPRATLAELLALASASERALDHLAGPAPTASSRFWAPSWRSRSSRRRASSAAATMRARESRSSRSRREAVGDVADVAGVHRRAGDVDAGDRQLDRQLAAVGVQRGDLDAAPDQLAGRRARARGGARRGAPAGRARDASSRPISAVAAGGRRCPRRRR